MTFLWRKVCGNGTGGRSSAALDRAALVRLAMNVLLLDLRVVGSTATSESCSFLAPCCSASDLVGGLPLSGDVEPSAGSFVSRGVVRKLRRVEGATLVMRATAGDDDLRALDPAACIRIVLQIDATRFAGAGVSSMGQTRSTVSPCSEIWAVSSGKKCDKAGSSPNLTDIFEIHFSSVHDGQSSRRSFMCAMYKFSCYSHGNASRVTWTTPGP